MERDDFSISLSLAKGAVRFPGYCIFVDGDGDGINGDRHRGGAGLEGAEPAHQRIQGCRGGGGGAGAGIETAPGMAIMQNGQ